MAASYWRGLGILLTRCTSPKRSTGHRHPRHLRLQSGPIRHPASITSGVPMAVTLPSPAVRAVLTIPCSSGTNERGRCTLSCRSRKAIPDQAHHTNTDGPATLVLSSFLVGVHSRYIPPRIRSRMPTSSKRVCCTAFRSTRGSIEDASAPPNNRMQLTRPAPRQLGGAVLAADPGVLRTKRRSKQHGMTRVQGQES
jgi:hypothetical protein